MLDPDRTIYERSPLKLVTFQLQFPPVPELDDLQPPRALSSALRERYPIIGPPPFMQLDFAPGQANQRARGTRLLNRARTWTITLTGDAVSIETSRYQRFEKFAEQLDWVLERVHAVTPIPAVTRIGLRYIDEIEIAGTQDLPDWKQWISEDLLAGGLVSGYRTHDYIVQAVLEVDEHKRMVVRYGRVVQPVVDPNGALRILDPPKSPYFLLDIDSFWEPSREEYREFDPEEVRAVSLELHAPIRDLFERAITPALRERFVATKETS